MGRSGNPPGARCGHEDSARHGCQPGGSEAPDFPWGALISTIIASEAASVFEPLISSDKVNELADPSQIEGLKAGLTISSLQYLKAMRVRTMVQKSFRELFENVDMIVAPSRYGIAPKISEPLDGPSAAGPDQSHTGGPECTI